MRKFTTGLLIGSAAAVAGISYLVQDKHTRKKIAKRSRKVAGRAEEVIDDLMDNILDR